MTRAFVHDLHVFLPSALGQDSLCHELGKLSFIVGVVDGSGTKAVPNGQSNVILGADIENVVPMIVGEVFFVMKDVPL